MVVRKSDVRETSVDHCKNHIMKFDKDGFLLIPQSISSIIVFYNENDPSLIPVKQIFVVHVYVYIFKDMVRQK